MKRKISLSLLALFGFFTTATLISTLYITNTTRELFTLVTLHEIEELRRSLFISVQTVQSDLYTLRTPMGPNLDLIIHHVATLDQSAEQCMSCHHRESVYLQIQNSRSLIEAYKNALSYYITASADKSRILRIQSEAANIGNQLLRETEDMSVAASERLAQKTALAMKNVNYARIVIFIILASSLLLALLVAVRLTRSITKPIGELVRATKVIASGSVGHTIADDDRTEFGELARNFNAMSISLQDGYQRLEAANRELQRQIRERKRIQEQLRQSQKMEAIGTLAGGIAHDFNNILMSIINYTELAINSTPETSPAWLHLQKILAGERRAEDLVRQILLFSRQSEQERKPVRIDSLIHESMRLIRASLPSTVEIRQQINADAGIILADATQLVQVLMNLCANAEHAMRDKGGVLEVSVDAVDLDEDAAAIHPELRPGPYVHLLVRDSGHGMEPEVVERIFEPFFSTKEAGQGTGMGLAVVHGIVASHGGAITVKSAPGKGATFGVYLPSTAGLIEDESETAEPSAHGTERILYVDDEVDLVDAIGKNLEDLGYAVIGKNSGAEALETFRAAPDRVDLIVTDQSMPDARGDVLVKEFRRIRSDIPIILCTGYSHVVDADKAKELGVDAFCLKPMVARDLGLAIRRIMAQRMA